MESYFKDECEACKGELVRVEGLKEWLEAKGYARQQWQVERWCEKNGAVLLEEVKENWEEILEYMQP